MGTMNQSVTVSEARLTPKTRNTSSTQSAQDQKEER